MASTGKRTIAGALIALGGAYVWALVAFMANGWGKGELWSIPLVAGYAVLITSWFVLPIGGLLGLAMPSFIRGCSGGAALFRGALLGVCAGAMAAGLTTVFMEWPSFSVQGTIVDRGAWLRVARSEFTRFATTMIPFCALWVGVWACRWRKIAEPYAAANGVSPRR
jgi:hypothetical protein